MDTASIGYPRDVVRVSGPDAQSYLQSQLSNDVGLLAVGGHQWAFLLQPTGKVEVLARVTCVADDEFLLDTDAGFGEAMVARLNRFKIRVKVDVEPVAEAPWPAPAGSAEELERARIDAGWPKMGAEIQPGVTIPAETGITDRAVSFTKGCYPGQELVERMDSRGASAPRQVRRIDVPPGTAAGDEVDVDGHRALVTSVAGTAALALVRRA